MCLFLIALLALTSSSFCLGDQEIQDPFLVMEELDNLAAKPLWPGFDPATYPVAIYDGEKTYLFHHPGLPEGFQPCEGSDGVSFYIGRHPAMRSNSKAEIGGATTATILLTIKPGRPVLEEASIIVHETFHIFQDTHHPTWRANEAYRYSYPITDKNNYLMTILEDHALGKALSAEETSTAAAWAARAMALRADRQKNLVDHHIGFELGMEMMEGTAFYVAHLALGEADSTETLLNILPPDQFRWRPYATGCAIAALLDRFVPGWKGRIEEDKELTLEAILIEYLPSAGIQPADFEEEEISGFETVAEKGVADLLAQRESRKEYFRNKAGWKVTVVTADGAEPLVMRGFNPINVFLLGDRDMLHGHRLILSSSAGDIEMENPAYVRRDYAGLNAVTTSAGADPLFSGFNKVIFAGFQNELEINSTENTVELSAAGFHIKLEEALLERSGQEITITLK